MPRKKRSKYHNEDNQFRTYYCLWCLQVKPCGLLTSGSVEDWRGICCCCYYKTKKPEYQALSDYAANLAEKKQEWEADNQKLLLLLNYAGCPKCGSGRVNNEQLEQGKIVCQRCLEIKARKATGFYYEYVGEEFSFGFWAEMCHIWKIKLREWMEKFRVRPVDVYCAEFWRADPNHLPPNCGCLERRARELAELFTKSLQRLQAEMKNCTCEVSKKTRTDFEWTKCENCEKRLDAASKKRFIKNRNDPQFWGLEISPRTLCLACIQKNYFSLLIGEKRKTFRRYLKRGYV